VVRQFLLTKIPSIVLKTCVIISLFLDVNGRYSDDVNRLDKNGG